MTAGIYQIKNEQDSKRYIGGSINLRALRRYHGSTP